MKNSFIVTLVSMSVAFGAGCSTGTKVEFVSGENKVDVLVDGRHFTSYRYGEDLTKPVLYPVHTPSGIAVNRSYPLEKVAGESTDHPHHCGIFFTYDKVNGEGFWNNTTSPPQIKHIEVTEMKGGDGKGTLSTVMHWIGKSGQVLLEEKRTMVILPGGDEYTVDFCLDLTAKDEKVVFEDTKEGMFAIRTADWLREKDGTGKYLSSNGDETEENIWGKRAKWVRLQGEKDGKIVGIAILNHPSSVNHPTYWHARGYGLFSANPLGQYDFEKKPNPETAKHLNFTLARGQTARFLFRMIIYEGGRAKQQLDAKFRAFAK
jgi:hypothetical protein